jgi:predicted methyltransferase
MSKEDIIESLSPGERKVLPHIEEKNIKNIIKKSGLDETGVIRALQFLENKGLLKIKSSSTNIIDLGTNGIYYKKNHLPERQLITLLEKNNHLGFEEAQKLSKLTENEFKVALGVLKKKALINISNGKLGLTATKDELMKKYGIVDDADLYIKNPDVIYKECWIQDYF